MLPTNPSCEFTGTAPLDTGGTLLTLPILLAAVTKILISSSIFSIVGLGAQKSNCTNARSCVIAGLNFKPLRAGSSSSESDAREQSRAPTCRTAGPNTVSRDHEE